MSDRSRIAKLASLPVLALCGFLVAAMFAGVGLGLGTTDSTSTETTTTTTTTPPGDEGCTPGFWKNLDKHLDEWTGLTPGQSVESVFDVPDSLGIDSKTLIQVLGPPASGAINGSGPNGSYQLLRHAIAALLNANSPDVDYPFDPDSIVADTNAALATQDADTIEDQKDEFADANEAGCPL